VGKIIFPFKIDIFQSKYVRFFKKGAPFSEKVKAVFFGSVSHHSLLNCDKCKSFGY